MRSLKQQAFQLYGCVLALFACRLIALWDIPERYAAS